MKLSTRVGMGLGVFAGIAVGALLAALSSPGRPATELLLIAAGTAIVTGIVAVGLVEVCVVRPMRALERSVAELHARLDVEPQRVAVEMGRRMAEVAERRHAERFARAGKLTGTIAHEVGTPLNVILGRAALVLEDAPSDDLRSNARIIIEQTRRITGLIRRLLDDAWRGVDAHEPVALAELGRDVVFVVEPLVRARGIVVRANPDEEEVDAIVEGDAAGLMRVVVDIALRVAGVLPSGDRMTISVVRTWGPRPGSDGAEVERFELRARSEGAPRGGADLARGIEDADRVAGQHGGWIEVDRAGRGLAFCLPTPTAGAQPNDTTS